jgi:Xaa-Pro dipeptidase
MKPPHDGPRTRITNLQNSMKDADIDVILLGYSRSTLYYAGTTQPSILSITPEDYHLTVIRGMEWVMEETWLKSDKISSGNGYGHAKERLTNWKIEKGSLGLELDILPAGQYLQFSELFSSFNIVDISKLILEQRKIKDAEEIEHTREACRIVHCGHQRILDVLREEMTELELSSEIEDAHRKAGHEGLYFIRQFDFFMGRGPVGSGANLSKIAGKIGSVTGVGLSPSIPMGASSKRIKKGEMIVVDIPTHYRGYHADQSRTYVLGDPPDICRSMYDGMKEIADQIIEMLRPGISCDDLHKKASRIAEETGMSSYFMHIGVDSKKVPFIGHGVGLELNEPPLLCNNNHEVLEEGMIIALELEMCGSVGEVVKLEDMLLITSGGSEILTITPRALHRI